MPTINDHLVPPLVNLNGTSAEALLEQSINVSLALHKALEAMGHAAPHGRDYQTAQPGSYERARDAFSRRLLVVATLRQEFDNLSEVIAQQLPERRKAVQR